MNRRRRRPKPPLAAGGPAAAKKATRGLRPLDPRKGKKQKGQRVKVLARRKPPKWFLSRGPSQSRAADRNQIGP